MIEIEIDDGDLDVLVQEDPGGEVVVLIGSPPRRAFADIIRDPEYRAVTHLRSDALVESVLQPTVPVGAGR